MILSINCDDINKLKHDNNVKHDYFDEMLVNYSFKHYLFHIIICFIIIEVLTEAFVQYLLRLMMFKSNFGLKFYYLYGGEVAWKKQKKQ